MENKTKFDPKVALLQMGVEEELTDDFLTLRKAKKAPVTATALKLIIVQADKASYTLTEAIEMIIDRNWIGFRSDWLENKFKPINNANFTNVGNMQAETKMQRNARISEEAYQANLNILSQWQK